MSSKVSALHGKSFSHRFHQFSLNSQLAWVWKMVNKFDPFFFYQHLFDCSAEGVRSQQLLWYTTSQPGTKITHNSKQMLSSVARGGAFRYQHKNKHDWLQIYHFALSLHSISMEVPKHFDLPFCIQHIDPVNQSICQNMQPVTLYHRTNALL